MKELPPDAEAATGGAVQTKPGVGEREARAALIAGVFCYVAWGFMPLLFKVISDAGVDAWETTAQRCLWATLFAGALVWVTRQGGELARVVREPKTLAWLALSALLIGANWSIFTWASQNHHNLEASLGYYLNPLINMAAGAVLFRERIDRFGWAAIAFAVVGVVLQAVALGSVPLISLGLALSFGAYGVIRKQVRADALPGLFIETIVLLPPAAAIAFWFHQQGADHLGEPLTLGLLIFSGLFTVIPLAAFAWAARRMPLSTMGFLQFIAPSMQFMWGALLGEPLGALRIASFGFIWAGVVIFAVGAWMRTRKA